MNLTTDVTTPENVADLNSQPVILMCAGLKIRATQAGLRTRATSACGPHVESESAPATRVGLGRDAKMKVERVAR